MKRDQWKMMTVITAAAVAGGCIEHRVRVEEPIRIEAKIDVNLKVDRQLDDFFSDVQKKATDPASDKPGVPAPESK